MSIKFEHERDYANQLVQALKSGDETQIKQAWASLHDSIAEQVKADYQELQESNDAAVLAQRGYRQLTSKETKWYQKVIEALKSNQPKQMFTELLGSDQEEDLMPTTIIEDVYKNLREDHPLLQAINFQYVGFITKWILNDHTAQTAVWGEITDEITKEIKSAFRTEEVNQFKLSAFAIIEHGMLDLGPAFLDGYIRTCLTEAILAGLELAIVAGTGVKQPVGLIKDIHQGVSFNSETGYPDKTAEVVTDFTPATYGKLIAKMAVTERGKKRKFGSVCMVVNQTDYLTKVLPATTVQNVTGNFVRDLFPFPTTVYVSNAVEDGKAILFLKDEYFMAMGGNKNGVIEYSDDYKFLEDQRVFKIKQYGFGKCYDNTGALYLDISGLEPAYITVKNHEIVSA
ncbi:MAG: phage major capsid protein [Akkermansia sp.]|nr:phage major capsid protein [Akkermansia sp.]